MAFKAKAVAYVVRDISEEEDEESEWVTPRSVGKILSRLGLRQIRKGNNRCYRERRISKKNLAALARAHGIRLPDEGEAGDHKT